MFYRALLRQCRATASPHLNRITLLVLLALTGPLPAPELTAQESSSQQTTQFLRPGDVIRLRIWREPDMSGDFPVDEAGMVVFPRVGEYRVLDDTPEQLSARLLADYQRYLRNPSIEIVVLRRVRIMGAVLNPGLHLVDPTVTVADALAVAGGATERGDPERIQILRDGQQLAVNIRQDTRLADSLIRSGDQIVIPERSWVSRNSGVVAASITGAISLVIALFIR